jgi:hypothetical protein
MKSRVFEHVIYWRSRYSSPLKATGMALQICEQACSCSNIAVEKSKSASLVRILQDPSKRGGRGR